MRRGLSPRFRIRRMSLLRLVIQRFVEGMFYSCLQFQPENQVIFPTLQWEIQGRAGFSCIKYPSYESGPWERACKYQRNKLYAIETHHRFDIQTPRLIESYQRTPCLPRPSTKPDRIHHGPRIHRHSLRSRLIRQNCKSRRQNCLTFHCILR